MILTMLAEATTTKLHRDREWHRSRRTRKTAAQWPCKAHTEFKAAGQSENKDPVSK